MPRTTLFQSVQHRILQARSRAWLASNSAMVMLFWDIGKTILLKEMARNGDDVIDQVARHLGEFHPKGMIFSKRNLRYMRKFAAAYPDRQAARRLFGHLPWRKAMAALDELG